MLPRLLIGIRSRDRIAPIATALAMLVVSAQTVVSTKAAAEDFNIREPGLKSSRPVDVPGATTRPLPDTPKSDPTSRQYGSVPKGEPTNQYGNIPKGEPSSQYGSVPKGEPQYGNVPKGEPQYGSVPKGEQVSQPGTAATGEAKPPTRPDQSQYQDVPTTPPQNNAPPQRNAGRPDQSQYQDMPQTPQQNTGRPNQSQYQDIPKPPVDQPGLKPRNEYGSVTPKDPYLNDPDGEADHSAARRRSDEATAQWQAAQPLRSHHSRGLRQSLPRSGRAR